MATDNNRVVLDYTNRDYLSLRAALVGLAKGYMPDWETVGEPGDFGTLLLELYAYTGDVMNYYVDRMASEAYLTTAVRRQSVLFIADMLGYQPLGKVPAIVPLTFKWAWDGGSTTVLDSNYVVSKAEVEGDTVTLTFPVGTDASFSVGQTISVENIDPKFSGVHNIDTVTPAEDSQDSLKITYRVTGAEYTDYAVLDASGSVSVRTGEVIRIPTGTRLSASSEVEGEPIIFELQFDVVLDSSNAQPTNSGDLTGEWSTLAYGTAIEGTTVTPTLLGISKGVPGAEFVIPKAGVFDGTVEVYTREGEQYIPWTRLDKISFAGPRQNIYTTYVDDEDFTHILFGDDIAGRIPPSDSEILVAYRYGVGAAANRLGVRSITTFESDEATNAGVSVFNSKSPTGGTDVESVESMRYTIPRSESVQDRGVTLSDFEFLSLRVPGVTRAKAYGDTYSAVYVRIASSAQSQPYTTTPITHILLTPSTMKFVLSEDVTPSLYQDQLVHINGDFLPNQVTDSVPTTVADAVPGGRFIPLESVRVYLQASGSRGPIEVEFVTTEPHNLKVDRPVSLAGVNALLGGTVFDGTHLVTGVDTIISEDDVPEIRVFKIAVSDIGTLNSDPVLEAIPFTVDKPGTVQQLPHMVASPGLFVAETYPLEEVEDVELIHTSPDMVQLMSQVEDYMELRKLVGTTVYAEPVQWEDIVIRVHVTVSDKYSRKAVEAAAQERLEALLAYDNVDFGANITVGQVYRTILTTEGVEYGSIDELHLAGGSGVGDITVDPLKIPRLAPDQNDDMVTAVGGLVNT